MVVSAPGGRLSRNQPSRAASQYQMSPHTGHMKLDVLVSASAKSHSCSVMTTSSAALGRARAMEAPGRAEERVAEGPAPAREALD